MSNLSAARAPASEPWIDWGKAIAAQCIVWHHLVHYGPLAPRLRLWLPRLVDWLDQRALLAVQVFLVMGGYLAARSLWPQPGRPRITLADWPRRMAQRWRRLMPVYLAALALALLGAALARHGLQDADTPAAPTLAQLAANALLLQDVLGQDALSAGLWYVAIDLQLFALLAALAAVAALWQPAATPPPWRGPLRTRTRTIPAPARRAPALWGVAALGAAALASLCAFNLDAAGDAWAPYFFGSYALGVLAAWGRADARRARWAGLIVALAAAGLLLAWRDRVALAALVALLLLWQPGRERMAGARVQPLMAWLAALSYALFLVHYPVSLMANTVFEAVMPPSPAAAAVGLLFTWAVSLGLAWLLWRVLEQGSAPWQRWQAPWLGARRAAG